MSFVHTHPWCSYNENDDVMNVMNIVEKCCYEIGVTFCEPNEKHRVYHVVNPLFDCDTKQKVRSKKLKSWELQIALY